MDAIAEIYEALDSEEAFARLPEILASAAGARSAILQVFDGQWEIQGAHVNYFTEEMLSRYVELELWRRDPWKAPAARAPDQLVVLDEAVPIQGLMNSTFFHENFRFWGDDTVHCLGGVFSLSNGYFTVGLHRGLGARDFSETELARSRNLAPHVRRVFEMRNSLGAAQSRARFAEAALEAQPNAVFVVDARGRPCFMNQQASALVAKGDSVLLTRLGLKALRFEDERRLRHAIETACARKGPQGGAFQLSGARGTPLRVMISPLGTKAGALALVVVNDPAQPDPGVVEALRGYYGLTTAEAQTAAGLANGRTPTEVAIDRGVSVATTRTQIREILHKTEARGLAQIAALVVSAPARRKVDGSD